MNSIKDKSNWLLKHLFEIEIKINKEYKVNCV